MDSKTLISDVRFCACGCGHPIVQKRSDRESKYINGHNRRGIPQDKASSARQKFAKAQSEKMKNLFGADRPNWKGGRLLHQGYVRIRVQTHPRAPTGGYVAEHILVAEMKLGRFLEKNEIVHHVDMNPSNNDPNNLFVCGSRREHNQIHHLYERLGAEAISRGLVSVDLETKEITWNAPSNNE